MRLTFGTGPISIEVGQSRLVTNLLKRLRRLVVDLEETTRSPPASAFVFAISHIEVGTSASTPASAARRVVARVKGDGALEKNWGRQLGGIVGQAGGIELWSEAQEARVTQ